MRHCIVFWRNVCYHIFHWFAFLCVKHMQWFFSNFVCLKQKTSLFQEIVQLIVVLFAAKFVVCFILCLSFFWCSFLEAPICTIIVMTVKHVFKRNLTCLTQLFNCFFSLFIFIMYSSSFLSRRASALVDSHRWALILLTVKKMCLATTFMRWEGSARKEGSGISSSTFS